MAISPPLTISLRQKMEIEKKNAQEKGKKRSSINLNYLIAYRS